MRTVRVLRGLELRKAPSVAETIDWGRTLLALGLDTLDDDAVRATLGVVLKHQYDVREGRRRAPTLDARRDAPTGCRRAA